MHIEVIKIAETPNSTLSQMCVDGVFFCFVLEDGFRAKKVPGETRIPEGTYELKPRREGSFFKKYSKKFGHTFVPHVTDVPGFEFILINIGNRVIDTRGCTLVGDLALKQGSNFEVSNSTLAYLRLYSILEPEFEAGRPVLITYNRVTLSALAIPAVSA